MEHHNSQVCHCPHHSIIPWMIIVSGIALLLGALEVLTQQWTLILISLFVIVIGGTKLNSHKCGCCHDK